MAREVKNVAASVRARLLNLAQQSGRDFQLLLTNYALERLLYRLSVSPYRDRFVLKGALLFTVWLEDPFRPTRDLDLLGHGDAETAAIAAVFREILSQTVPGDGLVFDVDGLDATVIREDARYGGIRIETTATLERAWVPVRIDIGFGDVVTPRPAEIDYPTLLDAPAPHLRAYPRETVVAEKLEAIVSLGFPNSRMKDFYDLAMIGRHFEFEGGVLVAAVKATFERRRTGVPVTAPDGLSDEFVAMTETQKRWQGFLARDQLATDAPNFGQCVEEIRRFLLPVLAAASGSRDAPGHWPAGGPWKP
jgi:predicted nucleotidyltransferase component of viral defense system